MMHTILLAAPAVAGSVVAVRVINWLDARRCRKRWQ